MLAINSETPYQRIRGGERRFSPSGAPNTMPHLDHRYDGPPTAILVSCCNAPLVPPNGYEHTETAQCPGISAAAAATIKGRSWHPITS